MADFATTEQLAVYWRALTPEETTRAEILITLASNRLRLVAEADDIDLDAKVTASEAFGTTIRWVVMEAVKRALQAPIDREPVESASITAGPYSENYKYTNPTGDLWFKKSELLAIGLSGRQTMKGLSTAPDEDFYS